MRKDANRLILILFICSNKIEKKNKTKKLEAD